MLTYRALLALTLFVSVSSGALAASRRVAPKSSQNAAKAQITKPALPAASRLDFREFFTATSKELTPTDKLLSLNGKRVRLVGCMVKMEEPPEGGFYLCKRPVVCDESGNGDADLPPETVYVIVRSAKGKVVPFIPRPIEVTGILAIGAREDSAGRTAMLSLTLDRLEDLPRSEKTTYKHASPSQRKERRAK